MLCSNCVHFREESVEVGADLAAEYRVQVLNLASSRIIEYQAIHINIAGDIKSRTSVYFKQATHMEALDWQVVAGE